MPEFLQSRKNDQFREGSWIFAGLRSRSLGGKQKIRDAMSYSIARESVRTAWASVREDPDKYGQQSLRSGGVSVAAAAGVPDRLIQHHGGWKREAGMKRYFAESLPNLLLVSQTSAFSSPLLCFACLQ